MQYLGSKILNPFQRVKERVIEMSSESCRELLKDVHTAVCQGIEPRVTSGSSHLILISRFNAYFALESRILSQMPSHLVSHQWKFMSKILFRFKERRLCVGRRSYKSLMYAHRYSCSRAKSIIHVLASQISLAPIEIHIQYSLTGSVIHVFMYFPKTSLEGCVEP